MQVHKFNITEWAEQYINNTLSEEERTKLLNIINQDTALKKEWDESLDILNILNNAGRHQMAKKTIANEHQAYLKDTENSSSKRISFTKTIIKKWRLTAIVAGVIFVSSTSTFLLTNNGNEEQNNHKFTKLSREIESIKSTQNKLENTIASTSKEKEESVNHTPQLGGTGFAISNDGYIATNYHVVKNSNEITVQTNDNKSYSAYLVSFDPNSDIAILKINKNKFQFGKDVLPYSFAVGKSSLGLKIFTIGYPQDELVYNEGYISCEKGYEGDTLSYQLEVISNPGQSGSPVLDTKGNVIGIITGKRDNTPGTTFANQTQSLINLINNLPEANKLKINTKTFNNIQDRTEQVKKYKNYIVSVKTK